MPIYYNPGPEALISDFNQSQGSYSRVMGVIGGYNALFNGVITKHFPMLLFTGSSGAVAAAGSFTIRDESGTFKTILVHRVFISPSVAGQCHLAITGTEIWRGVLEANKPFLVDFGDMGVSLFTLGNILTIVNDTAGAVTYQISAYGDAFLQTF